MICFSLLLVRLIQGALRCSILRSYIASWMWPHLNPASSQHQSFSPYSSSKLEGNQRDEIRLVRLEPGAHGSRIRASLIVTPLRDVVDNEEQLKYEAVSYVWGDGKNKKMILLEGQRFWVTRNLHAALQHIRKADTVRTLWIDALSINQSDVPERNSQVLLMNAIYRKSTKVLVWLGSENAKAKRAVQFIRSMKNYDHIAPCDSDIQDRSACPNGLSSLCAILTQEWWERTWTLQEILLAREAELLCGNVHVPWNDLVQAFTNAKEHYYTIGCCYDVPRCPDCREQYFRFRENIGGLNGQQRKLQESGGLDLLDLLANYRFRKVSVDHDKVYALLGLAGSIQRAPFDPDYSCLIEDLCIKTAVCNIGWSRSLRSLNYAANIDSKLRIPSWVTDWTAHSNYTGRTALQTRFEEYNAARGCEWSGTFRGMLTEPYSNCCTLSTDGILFDTIKIVGEPSVFRLLEESYAVLRQWFALVQEQFDLESPYIGGGTVKGAFWRTLTGDVVIALERYRRASNVHEQDFNTWWDAVNGGVLGVVHGSGMSAFLENITTAISRRRLFITEKGYIGNGPLDTRIGDQVFILCGGKMPLVLRSYPSETFEHRLLVEPRPIQKLVGDSYVHGIMDGEAASNFHERSQPVRLK